MDGVVQAGVVSGAATACFRGVSEVVARGRWPPCCVWHRVLRCFLWARARTRSWCGKRASTPGSCWRSIIWQRGGCGVCVAVHARSVHRCAMRCRRRRRSAARARAA
eukprot:scaffold1354_cov111-Isochrysis_galbana.AAC.10